MRHLDRPRNHESTKPVFPKNVFVFSCFRGFLLLAILLGGRALVAAADPTSSMIDRAVAIQVSLSHDKMDGVSTNATGIATDAGSLGKPGEKIVAGAMALQKSKKIDEAREAFGRMSEALVAYLDAQKEKPGNGVRVAYCPMVRKPWLQKDGAIQNPYYGASMLTCGSFKP
jgi:hypothetical protein